MGYQYAAHSSASASRALAAPRSPARATRLHRVAGKPAFGVDGFMRKRCRKRRESGNMQVKPCLTLRTVATPCKCFDAIAMSGMLIEDFARARPGRVRRTDRLGGARTRVDR